MATKPWKNYSSSVDKQTYYRINYEFIFESLARLNKRNYLTLESINESLLISITTGQDAKSRDLIEDRDRVRVICVTVHASKGLEYDTVVLPYTQNKINEIKRNTVEISCDEGKVGYCFSIKADRFCNEYFDTKYEVEEIEKEESRILYVALTRAINKCIWFSKVGNTNYNWNRLMEYAE
jgi:ATP-dependent exoDNAse (exonuclease V) beta subunit